MRFSEEKMSKLNQTETRTATVRLVGNLCKLPDGSKIEVGSFEAPASLRNVIQKFREKYGIELKRENTLILVNGVEANALNDLDTIINEKDDVVFVPMFHGGS